MVKEQVEILSVISKEIEDVSISFGAIGIKFREGTSDEAIACLYASASDCLYRISKRLEELCSAFEAPDKE